MHDPHVLNPFDDPDSGLKPIPKDLVQAFLDGTKHPVSSIMEYGAIMKLVITFHEAKVEVSGYRINRQVLAFVMLNLFSRNVEIYFCIVYHFSAQREHFKKSMSNL